MRCNKCPALTKEGYEYPEYFCGLGISDDEMTEFKDGEFGCSRRSLAKIKKDLRTQREIDNQAFTEFAADFVKFMEEQESS